jgi:hypothetical protein
MVRDRPLGKPTAARIQQIAAIRERRRGYADRDDGHAG